MDARIRLILGKKSGANEFVSFSCWFAAETSEELKSADIILADYDDDCSCTQCPDDKKMSIIRRIVDENPKLSLVFFSNDDSERFIINAVKLGAKGIISQRNHIMELAQGIENVHKNGCHLSPDLSHSVFSALNTLAMNVDPIPKADRPTKSELQCVKLIAAGKSRKEVAVILNISTNTVQTHLLNLYRKLGAKDKEAAIRTLTRQGLIMR